MTRRKMRRKTKKEQCGTEIPRRKIEKRDFEVEKCYANIC